MNYVNKGISPINKRVSGGNDKKPSNKIFWHFWEKWQNHRSPRHWLTVPKFILSKEAKSVQDNFLKHFLTTHAAASEGFHPLQLLNRDKFIFCHHTVRAANTGTGPRNKGEERLVHLWRHCTLQQQQHFFINEIHHEQRTVGEKRENPPVAADAFEHNRMCLFLPRQ